MKHGELPGLLAEAMFSHDKTAVTAVEEIIKEFDRLTVENARMTELTRGHAEGNNLNIML